MRISKDQLRFIEPPTSNLFDGDAVPVNGDFTLHAMLRAYACRLAKSTGDFANVERASSLRVIRATSSDDIRSEICDDSYAVTIITKSDFPCEYDFVEGWRTFDGTVPPLVDKYLSQFYPTRVFVHEEKHRAVLIVDKVATQKWIQSVIAMLPRLTPWLIPEITPEIKSFAKSVSAESADDVAENAIVSFVQSVADDPYYTTMLLHKQLDGYAGRMKNRRLVNARSSYNGIAEDIRNYAERISNLYVKLEEQRIIISAIENSNDSDENVVYHFFEQHPQLRVVSVDDERLKYMIDETIEFFDEDEAKNNLENPRSYVHSFNDGENAEMVYKALFVDRLGVLHTQARCELSAMSSVRTIGETSGFDKDVIPHPHIARFGCDGSNGAYYNDFAKRGEWELGIEQTIAAVKNLNMGDSTVVNWAFSWLAEHCDSKCILTSLGSDAERYVSYSEFVDLLKNKGE